MYQKLIKCLICIAIKFVFLFQPAFAQLTPFTDFQMLGATNINSSNEVMVSPNLMYLQSVSSKLEKPTSDNTINSLLPLNSYIVTPNQIQEIPTSMMDIVSVTNNNGEKRVSQNGIFLDSAKKERQFNAIVLEEIERKYVNELKLMYPEQNTLVIKPTIQVKGINRFLTEIFVNGQPIKLRKDGRFFHTLTLDKFGKQNVYITYALPNYEPYTIKRKVTYLTSPPDLENYVLDRQVLIGFYNLDYFRTNQHKRKINSKFTRADLAYLICNIC